MARGEPTPIRSALPGREGPRFALRFEDGAGLLVLAKPLRFGLGVVDELTLSLGRLRFPLDLSGGPSRFRTHRTEVRTARVRLDVARVIDEVVEEPYELRLLAGSTMALRDLFGTLAFDVAAVVEQRDLFLVPERARSGSEGPAAPLIRVLAAARALGLSLDEGSVRIPRVLRTALAEALVPHGWRAPDDRSVRVSLRVERREVVLEVEDAPSDRAPLDRARALASVIAALFEGDRDRAERAWGELVSRGHEDALGAEAASLELHPAMKGPVAASLRLRRAVRAHAPEEAIAAAHELEAEEPCHAVAVEGLCAVADLVLGWRPIAAAELLELALARRPGEARIVLRLVEALARAGRPSALRTGAERALSAIEAGSARGELAREIARVCELAGATGVAREMWEHAHAHLPHDARVLEGIAGAMAAQGNALALARYDEAARAYGDEADREGERRALLRGASFAQENGRDREAEARLTRAAELAPDAELWARLALIRRRASSDAATLAAEDALLGAIESLPSARDSVEEALSQAARTALEAGRFERARSFANALSRLGAHEAGARAQRAIEDADLGNVSPERLRSLSDELRVEALQRARDPRALFAAALAGADATQSLALAHAAADERTSPELIAVLAAADKLPEDVALLAVLEQRAQPNLRAAIARTLSIRLRALGREADAARALARSGAYAGDGAILRAAIAAAERSGDRAALVEVLDRAIAHLGDSPARRELVARRARLA